MNPQIRRLMTAIAIMMLSLFLAATYVQFVKGPALRADPRNARTIYESWGRDRGPIIVDGTEIALSKKVDNVYGFQREYPGGEMYAPITGYSAVRLGQTTGLEAAATKDLDGTSLSLLSQRIQDLLTGKQPRGGAIDLTIDADLQSIAFESLKGRTGAIVALDPRDGKIRALMSTPTFDPNLLTVPDKKAAQDELEKLQDNKLRPLINRAIAGDRYPPGSVFKIITAAAALNSGKLAPDSEVDAPRELAMPGTTKTLKNYGGEACGSGKVSFAEAFARSCNTPFGALGMELGQEQLADMAKQFGFGADLSIPMPVTPSVFPNTDAKAQLAQSAIGQYEVQVTPMEVAMMGAAVANEGIIMTPYLIDKTMDRDLVTQTTTEPKKWRRALSPQVAQSLKEMMTGVVEKDYGTGTNAQIKGMQVAGKTGTAETGRGGSHAWFVGFAPADKPQLVVVAFLEAQPGEFLTGGVDAAPIARKLLKAGVK
ncbi:hypothetical protein BK816_00100 [Boudabousia tangfeifanii]|uniref:Uncharacterized protein n=1 Tax=Boudabousia tangfeifanii TaxID=1912795 RepID=A0A1D9MHW2_9ACTO|nr:penicillin-binding protein 2 [Boudabousia tangfeifanii]AOZ71884.1 hypothetical protein BK816_00100 [Boudabousia tangfeifanii]